ncbi:recombinase family protein [Sulfoacidibacillus thermotolerans]|uniref:Recombinase family protein n=1 Tax=Sulfoacidibacillus thermotolerans TaxID=1765684 RepID=A0A2U3DC84_SULT2|nr:recombinase family protein [Sulfoacidibacillus thermotolerans]PWI58872.1 hypothetical protein BM613_01950 [Sulfoacidibacillus thermotolerans]
MQRAAIYVRVSTEHEAQKDSPEHQVAACLEYATIVGLTTTPEFIYNDAGLSGTEMENRTEVKRLIRDARQGKFEAVLFTAISRFSRDMADAFHMKKKLESIYGIRLISLEEGYDSAIDGRNNEMVFTVHAMLAAHKSKEMSAAIKRGLRQSAKKGRHIGNIPPFGYQKTHDRRLQPEPEEAEVVREIFRLYLAGFGAKAIAQTLNARGIPTTLKRRYEKPVLWQASTITAILHNPVYLGTLIAHKWTTARHIEDSRRRDIPVKHPVVRAPSEWIFIEHAHEPIIDAQTFQRVQELLAKKAKNRGIKRSTNLLAGLMYCKNCGGKMLVSTSNSSHNKKKTPYKYIVCSKIRRIGKSACSNHLLTKYDEFLDALIAHLKQYSSSEFQDSLQLTDLLSKIGQVEPTLPAKIAQLQNELANNHKEQLANLRAFRQGLFPSEVIARGQSELMEQAKRLQTEINHLQAEHTERACLQNQLRDSAVSINPFAQMELFDAMTQRLLLIQTISKIEFSSDGSIAVVFTWGEKNRGSSPSGHQLAHFEQ